MAWDDIERLIVVLEHVSVKIVPCVLGLLFFGILHFFELDPGKFSELSPRVAQILLRVPSSCAGPFLIVNFPCRDGTIALYNVFGDLLKKIPPKREARARVGFSSPPSVS